MSRLLNADMLEEQQAVSKGLQDLQAMPALPAVDWEKIEQNSAQILSFDYQGPDAPLPAADVVVVTWTDAEWSALDHVFCNSSQPRTQNDKSWQKDWKQYSKGAPLLQLDEKNFNLWGFYRMVQMNGAEGSPMTILLFKAQTHLAYTPYIKGLAAMTASILTDTGCRYLYSVGTAGGAGETDLLGNTVVTNGGRLEMTNAHNKDSDLNKQTFCCDHWFPSFELIETIEQQLLYPLSNVATWDMYNQLLSRLQHTPKDSKYYVDMTGITVKDLVNPPLDPTNLHQPAVVNCKDKPLLTTDFYYIAEASDAEKYCILEMDDAVLAAVAGEKGVNYAFVRNVSDPIVPDCTKDGKPISKAQSTAWSSIIYSTFGFYTSYNGALATWATLQKSLT